MYSLSRSRSTSVDVISLIDFVNCYNLGMLTDADILQRLTNVEDATVERKVASDLRDVVRTAVALSNSLPVGDPGIIFFGVRKHEVVAKHSHAYLRRVALGCNRHFLFRLVVTDAGRVW